MLFTKKNERHPGNTGDVACPFIENSPLMQKKTRCKTWSQCFRTEMTTLHTKYEYMTYDNLLKNQSFKL